MRIYLCSNCNNCFHKHFSHDDASICSCEDDTCIYGDFRSEAVVAPLDNKVEIDNSNQHVQPKICATCVHHINGSCKSKKGCYRHDGWEPCKLHASA